MAAVCRKVSADYKVPSRQRRLFTIVMLLLQFCVDWREYTPQTGAMTHIQQDK
jgi:hypothetical protein